MTTEVTKKESDKFEITDPEILHFIENPIIQVNRTLNADEKDTFHELIKKACKLLKSERKETPFTILYIQITLDLFKKPYVRVWTKNDENTLNKIYRESTFLYYKMGGLWNNYRVHPTFQYNNAYKTQCPFILDFKPF
ncbi:MAG: hypothetical protein BAJALOKI1v1_1190006 [Promethearchaeota archaeon]|nr:MAG: hypothetical protein BAJALOKI1v1_1190006 [Candidatus Lokiarchaeota archaeon]